MKFRNDYPPGSRKPSREEAFELESIAEELGEMDSELRTQFQRLPKELWKRHFDAVKKIGGDTGNAGAANEMRNVEERAKIAIEQRRSYMTIVIEAREKAIVEYGALDEQMKQAFPEGSETQESLGRLLREALTAEGNFLGAGRTARVKSVAFPGLPKAIAVKYLLTPTEKTLSVDRESKILSEVERLTMIEEAEHRLGAGNRIRVPHPYFHFQRQSLQAYGMSEVEGVNLESMLSGASEHILLKDSILDAVRERYATEEEQAALWKELGAFLDAMHEVCLHGDVKDRNIMVDVEGTFHLIDFGQSLVPHRVPGESVPQFENMQDAERREMRFCIQKFLLFAFAAAE